MMAVDMLKVAGRGLGFLFSLFLSLLLIFTALRLAIDLPWLYEYSLVKYQASQTTGLTPMELKEGAARLRRYFASAEEPFRWEVNGKPVFSEREVVHLRDVKGLVQTVYWAQMVALGYCLAYVLVGWVASRRFAGLLARQIVFGSGLTLGLLSVLGMGAAADFDRLFLQFHLVSFANDFWLLDPARDNLIRMFPPAFFLEATLAVAALATAMALVLGGAAIGYLRIKKPYQAKRRDMTRGSIR